MQLFKFCSKKYMDEMLNAGSARIGTLFDWRRTGAYGEMSGDEVEGIIRNHGGNLIFYDPSFIRDMQIDSTVRVEGEGEKQLRHFKIDAIRSTDVYTFCASASYSEDQHRVWLQKEGYDACYRINSAKLFFRAFTEKMLDADFLFFKATEYLRTGEANHEIFGRFHAALLKRADGYDDQREVRALWKPKSPVVEIKPRIIESSSAGRYCDPYRVLN